MNLYWTDGVHTSMNDPRVKVKVVTYFARDPLSSYFHEPQKNEIYFLNKSHRIGVGHQWLPRGVTKGSFWYGGAARHL